MEILDLLLGAGVDWHKGVRGRPAADVARELLVAWDAYAADRAAELPRELAATIHEGRAAIVQRLEALPHEARPPGERWGE